MRWTDERSEAAPGACKFNVGVVCGNYNDCECCGWNPTVAEIRRQKTKNENERKGKST